MEMTHRRAIIVGDDEIATACSHRLAADGYDILCAGTAVDETVRAINGTNEVSAIGVEVDLGYPLKAAETITKAASHWPSIHALVNCHFHVEPGGVANLTIEHWQRALDINCTGPLATTQALLDLLAAAKGAAVVHLGSVDGIFGNPMVAAYSASKAALIPLTHIMAHEFADLDIRVNMVARALVTSSDAAPLNDYQAAIAQVTPLKRAALTSEIASTVAFLVSSDSSYVSGTVLTVDGGRTGITRGTG